MPFDELNTASMSEPTLATVPAGPASFASQKQTRVLGGGLILLALALAYLFLVFWNGGIAGKATDPQQVCAAGNYLCFHVSSDAKLLILVMLAGALGSFIHAATSFGDFVGNKRLTTNWLWWYILKPFIGTVLAVIFYLCVRGGFLSGATQADSINLYGITALAGLVGMFSKQATDKLSEVFDTMFKTSAGDLKRKEGLDNPVPVLSGSEPARLAPGARDVVITLTGKGFVNGSVVQINGSARTTTFKDSTHLSAALQDADTAREGQMKVTVVNPAPGGGTSEQLVLTIADLATTQAPTGESDSEHDVDSCDVAVTLPTADEDLPAARGGVAS
ncbi:IPT/TIG domain-containing protein [Massilia sp. S19_KUP03_FR1]|uniref:IPT/TIG domain-containing protein n=1 Tax=Massilia sp. S19_KUP03_FR1 TaxID=3025503 RepID=UPI002FCD8E34